MREHIDPYSELMITPSEVIEYIFCPRFIYFMNVMKIAQYEDRRYKVLKGRSVHEHRRLRNKSYIRKKIPMIRKESEVYLADRELGVRGIVDEIIYLKDGSVSPVDYKYTEYREWAFKTHKIQLTLYGMLIEKINRLPVNKGYIIYVRGGHKESEIELTDRLKKKALTIVREIREIIYKEIFPKKTSNRMKCTDCTYKNICIA